MRSTVIIAAVAAFLALPVLSAAAPAGPASPPPEVSAAKKPDTPPNVGGRYLNQVMATSQHHKKSVADLLRGKRGLPTWARNLANTGQYVAGVSRMVTLPEGEFELFSACSPRQCTTSHLKLLFTPDGTKAWFWSTDPKTGDVALGMPSAAQLQLLQQPGI